MGGYGEDIFREINPVGVVIIMTAILDRNIGEQMYFGSWFQSPRHRGDQLEHVVQVVLITANQEAERASQELAPDYNLQTVTSTPVAYFSQQGSTAPQTNIQA